MQAVLLGYLEMCRMVYRANFDEIRQEEKKRTEDTNAGQRMIMADLEAKR